MLDPILGQHLAFFGIDFSSLQKVIYSLTDCLSGLFNFFMELRCGNKWKLDTFNLD